MKSVVRVILAAGCVLLLTAFSTAFAEQATLMLHSPAVSAQHLVFVYGGDLWLAERDGNHVRRLTVHPGSENSPVFSPDGQWIAFTANYDGNTDIYRLPIEGGTPQRVTYHPGRDVMCDWSPDGRTLLIISNRLSINGRYQQLFTVPAAGGFPVPLPPPMAEQGVYSPDGSSIAYTPLNPVRTWKRYRGGRATPIWLMDLKTCAITEIPREVSSDTSPMWIGRTVYFLSDRNFTVNLFAYDLDTRSVQQVTHHTDYDIKSASSGAGVIVYEQAGRVHMFDPATATSQPVPLEFQADLLSTRPHYVPARQYINGVGLSPTGAEILAEIRGDVYVIDRNGRRFENLTRTPGVYERFPVWSPDGGRIAWFSDAGGEYHLSIRQLEGAKQTDDIALEPVSFYFSPQWSPDGSKIAFTGPRLSMYFIDVKDGKTVHIDDSLYDLASRDLHLAWSPDSRWIAYTRRMENRLRAIYLYDTQTRRSFQITDGQAEVMTPVFSRDGRFLYFAACTNTPGRRDLAFSEHQERWALYLAVLDPSAESPFTSAPALHPPAAGPAGRPAATVRAAAEKAPAVTLDPVGLDRRIVALPLPEGSYRQLTAGAGAALWYLESQQGDAGANLQLFDPDRRKSSIILSGITRYSLSGDGCTLLYAASNNRYGIVPAGAAAKAGDGIVDFGNHKIFVEPRSEWTQMFDDVWRFQRDLFYDPQMHGADWKHIREKYRKFLPHVTTRDDLNFLFTELVGELVVGHANVRGGDIPAIENVPVGLLGADFTIEQGYHRITRIYDNLHWSPQLRAPLSEPGLRVSSGDYLLAVNGQSVTSHGNLYRHFVNTVNTPVTLTINNAPTFTGAWHIEVQPVGNETELRQRHWVERNRRHVDKATNGRVAYIYVPDTAKEGYEYFNRYLFSQLDKEAVIIDERFNGGGAIPDYFIDMLQKPPLSYWALRAGQPGVTPSAAIFGPKVMLINGHAGSGGDAFPYFFRAAQLGKLIGTRTAGALIGGGGGQPLLMDGGVVGVPQSAIYSTSGAWVVENAGVEPDIAVDLLPAPGAEWQDPQLDAAIAYIMEELRRAPVRRPAPPAPPKRALEH